AAVVQHHTLWPSRGPAGVDEVSDRLWRKLDGRSNRIFCRQRSLIIEIRAGTAERYDVLQVAPGYVAQAIKQRGFADEGLGLAVGQNVGDLRFRQSIA